MAAGDVKLQYAASVALTQTALDALASSTTFLAGWESDAIDNSTNKYTDYRITARIRAESTGLTAGEIRMYLVCELDDTTWPDVFDGTQSAETITDAAVRDAICHLVAMSVTDTTASQDYFLVCPSVRRALGNVPRKFVVFITHSMVAATESTGDPNQVYVQGLWENVEPA